jgi:uncharacterized protein YbjT (DUF2867 family)
VSDRKIIAVLGATGAQGGGLVRAILDDPDGGYAARAITRNPASETARGLAEAGAEVVQADLDDQASLEKAFEGAYGVYGVTNFWEHFSPEKETAQGANIARASAAAGVSHAIWSTFEDTRKYVPLDSDQMPTLMGRYKVPHFDAKADANHFFTDSGVPTTFLLTSGYWENLIHFGWGPQRGEDGSLNLVMAIGDAKMPSIAAGDIGPLAYGVFKRGDELVGRSVGAAGEHLSGAEMAAQTSEALGMKIGYWAAPPEVYRSFDFPGAEDVGNMFQFKRDFEDVYRGNRDLDLARALHPGLRTYREWLAESGSEIPIPD